MCESKYFDAWLSLVERCVRDAEAAGSNPVASTCEKVWETLILQCFPRFFVVRNLSCFLRTVENKFLYRVRKGFFHCLRRLYGGFTVKTVVAVCRPFVRMPDLFTDKIYIDVLTVNER